MTDLRNRRVRTGARAVLAATAAMGFLAGTAEPSAAFLFDFGPRPAMEAPPTAQPAPPPVRRAVEPRRRQRPAASSNAAAIKSKPDKADPLSSLRGPFHVVISIDDQKLTLYDKGVPVAQSAVSTGVPGHPTPTGVFSVIQKRRMHHSNIYSGAPMPFMQRITWSGIALHAGVVPGRPASHGCIRLPNEFAARLWAVTKIGARVVIARKQVSVADFTHPRLFAWQPPAIAVADVPDLAVEVQKSVEQRIFTATAALRGEFGGGAEISASQAPDGAVRPAPPPPGSVGTTGASSEFPAAIIAALPPSEMKSSPPALRRGPISVFVSRKDRKLYVRKGFAPLFDAPATIDEPDRPVGTHLFTALDFRPGRSDMTWTVVSLPSDSRTVTAELSLRGSLKPGRESAARSLRDTAILAPGPSPAEALERLKIDPETLQRISEMMSPGASLIVSDHGLSHETGSETDFIVLTK